MARPKSNNSKLQLTIDKSTERILEDMIKLGIHGTSKAEVATSILRNWLWSNEEKLSKNGIKLSESD